MPTLVYWPICGRGGLIRLIADVGGVDLKLQGEMPEGITKEMCGSTGSVPVLIDGDLKMNESTAIEYYVASIAPKFANLTPQQRGKDAQFCSIKETILAGVAKIVFSDKDEAKIQAVADKYIPVLEGILPEKGFVNGLDFPTPADLAIVVICEGYMPFGSAYKFGKIDLATKYPKLFAHAQRTKAADIVAAVIDKADYLPAAMPGF